MRAVTSATAAEVLGVSRRTLDALLARLGDAAIPKGRQGVDRRIPIALLETLALTLELSRGLGLAASEAFHRSRALLSNNDSARAATAEEPPADEMPVGDFSTLVVDVGALRASMAVRLEAAIESVVRPRRGRPPAAS